jgi:DNA mismatch repair protein MutS2
MAEVAEYAMALRTSSPPPLSHYEDIGSFLTNLKIPGFVLDFEDILRIKNILHITQLLNSWLNQERRSTYPLICTDINRVEYSESYLRQIRKVINDQGEIKEDASPELVRIKRAIQSKIHEIDKVFNKLSGEYRSKELLSENVESYRGGRRVLSVPVENKRRVPGIIHDESATGKTVFIEPQELVPLNNEIMELEHSELREIAKIIRDLCESIRSGATDFANYLNLITNLDFLRAKALLALEYGGNQCRLLNEPELHLREAVHPYLYIKNKHNHKTTVPFELKLDKTNRILLISGPNAGGKSILMKSVGLIQLLAQSGFLVPVHPGSEIGTFNQIFAAIGDRQSIEEDLSTYSSHLKTMKYFVDHVDSRTLILIDEFGTGTDPDIGGVLAESMLAYFTHKHVWGVVTTHYSLLKLFAHNNKGIFNGSMLFDSEHLVPTYQFKPGSPGSSFAFELARASGLPGKITNGAEQKLGSKKYKVETLLNDLQREKREIENQLRDLKQQKNKLDQLEKNFNFQMQEMEVRRKKFRLELKEFQVNSINKQDEAIQSQIKILEKEQDLQKIKALAIAKKAERVQLFSEMNKISAAINHTSQNKNKQLAPGDTVNLRNGGAQGKIIRIDGNIALVEMGALKVEVTLDNLTFATQKGDLRKPKMVHTDLVSADQPTKKELDIRGFRRDEALTQVQKFVDNGLIQGLAQLSILHGKGDGILKKAIHRFLNEYQTPLRYEHPEADAGGDGITIIYLS